MKRWYAAYSRVVFFYNNFFLYIKHPTYITVLAIRPKYKKVHRPDKHNNGGDEGDLVGGGSKGRQRRIHPGGRTAPSVG
jgi:hypothetical protein